MNNEISEIIQFILYPEFTGWLLVIKIIFIFFAIFFIGFIVWAIKNTTWLDRLILNDLKNAMSYESPKTKKYNKEWDKIKKKLERGLDAEVKVAVVEADALLNNALRIMGYGDGSLDSKFEKLADDIIPNLAQVKAAHETQEKIIKDLRYAISREEAKKLADVYETALNKLDAI